MRPVVESLVASQEALCVAATRSRPHENGFDKVVLCNHAGWNLRLNLWWADRASHTENVHSHRWDFASTVLVGSFRADYFVLVEDGGMTLRGYDYARPSASADYMMQDVGPRQVRLDESVTVTAGESYILHSSRLHRVIVPEGQMVATLMLRTPAVTGSALTLTDATDYIGNASIDGKAFEPEHLEAQLHRFLRRY